MYYPYNPSLHYTLASYKNLETFLYFRHFQQIMHHGASNTHCGYEQGFYRPNASSKYVEKRAAIIYSIMVKWGIAVPEYEDVVKESVGMDMPQ